MYEKAEDEWEGHWFNPVAFAQKWYEDHPEVLERLIFSSNKLRNGIIDEDS
jgi:hypothetical protein